MYVFWRCGSCWQLFFESEIDSDEIMSQVKLSIQQENILNNFDPLNPTFI